MKSISKIRDYWNYQIDPEKLDFLAKDEYRKKRDDNVEEPIGGKTEVIWGFELKCKWAVVLGDGKYDLDTIKNAILGLREEDFRNDKPMVNEIRSVKRAYKKNLQDKVNLLILTRFVSNGGKL